MHLFSFAKKVTLTAPVGGTLMPLDKVADNVFSTGVGYAIDPAHDHIYSPVTGMVTTLFPDKQAIGIKAGDLDLLIHMSIDTAELNGDPFLTYVEEGTQVTPATPIAFMDRSAIYAAGKHATVMVVVTNAEDTVKSLKLTTNGTVDKSQSVAELVKK